MCARSGRACSATPAEAAGAAIACSSKGRPPLPSPGTTRRLLRNRRRSSACGLWLRSSPWRFSNPRIVACAPEVRRCSSYVAARSLASHSERVLPVGPAWRLAVNGLSADGNPTLADPDGLGPHLPWHTAAPIFAASPWPIADTRPVAAFGKPAAGRGHRDGIGRGPDTDCDDAMDGPRAGPELGALPRRCLHAGDKGLAATSRDAASHASEPTAIRILGSVNRCCQHRSTTALGEARPYRTRGPPAMALRQDAYAPPFRHDMANANHAGKRGIRVAESGSEALSRDRACHADLKLSTAGYKPRIRRRKPALMKFWHLTMKKKIEKFNGTRQ